VPPAETERFLNGLALKGSLSLVVQEANGRGPCTATTSSKKNDGSNIAELGHQIHVIFRRGICHGFNVQFKARSIICNLSSLGLDTLGFLSTVQVTAAT
ncbi:hypothetical protein Csa_018665, partial [Cucumis sativus]